MKKVFFWILSYIVAPLIVIAIAFFSGQWWEKRSEKYLYYEVINTGNLLSPVAGQTELTYNKRKIDNIGSIRVKVYNEDDIELDNISFNIGVTGKKPLRIHYMDYFDVDRKKKRVTSNYSVAPTDSVTSNEFSYTITPLNKSDKPVFELLINLEDVDNITVDFTMQVKGVEPKLYEPKENKKYWESPIYFYLYMFTFLSFTLFHFYARGSKQVLSQLESNLEYSNPEFRKEIIRRNILILEKYDVDCIDKSNLPPDAS